MKLLFTMAQWLEVARIISLVKSNPDDFTNHPSFKDKQVKSNKDKDIISEFFNDLRKKKERSKEIIREAYVNSRQDPFPELIEAPKTEYLHSLMLTVLEKKQNKELYITLLKNNNIPCYQKLIDRITYSKSEIHCHYPLKDESFVHIFRHALLICSPCSVQSVVEHLFDQYEEVEKIDSKKEAEERTHEIHYAFHKSLRQCDILDNAHAEMIIWELLQLTDVPYIIFRALYEHFKKESTLEKI